MAEIVSIHGVNHNPRFWRALQGDDLPEGLRQVREWFDRFAEEIRQAQPDAIVIVASDHMTQFHPENMPAFLVAKQEEILGTYYYETLVDGIPNREYRGDVDLASDILQGGIDRYFDLSFSHETRIDHSFVVPLEYLARDLDVPLVPIFTNGMCPPLPLARRYYQLGEMLREAVEASALDRRVAVITSGHASLEIGGPRQFEAPITPEFDAYVTELFAAGDVEGIIATSTFEKLLEVGNVSHQFLNFLVSMGVAGGAPTRDATMVTSRFQTPFYSWEA